VHQGAVRSADPCNFSTANVLVALQEHSPRRRNPRR
jgi:hypothetical protein